MSTDQLDSGGRGRGLISCKKAGELLSKALDGSLSTAETVALKFHLGVCSFCEEIKAQFELIRVGARELKSAVDSNTERDDDKLERPRFSESIRARLTALLAKRS